MERIDVFLKLAQCKYIRYKILLRKDILRQNKLTAASRSRLTGQRRLPVRVRSWVSFFWGKAIFRFSKEPEGRDTRIPDDRFRKRISGEPIYKIWQRLSSASVWPGHARYLSSADWGQLITIYIRITPPCNVIYKGHPLSASRSPKKTILFFEFILRLNRLHGDHLICFDGI